MKISTKCDFTHQERIISKNTPIVRITRCKIKTVSTVCRIYTIYYIIVVRSYAWIYKVTNLICWRFFKLGDTVASTPEVHDSLSRLLNE